jgi:hypothetical protein
MDNKNLELATSATSKIYEKVNRALAEKDTDKRWFWELLQNAKDTVVASKGKVDVRVVIDYNQSQEPFMRFEHNGNHFKHSNHRFKFDDPKCLLLADSGKIEEDETQREDITGQFGTGFLSTHILSLRILVEGVFFDRDEKYRNFSFELDRKYNNKFELAEKVEKSLNQYDSDFKLTQEPNQTEFHTKFTYYLNENRESLENGFEVVKKGIDGIENFIPYVLAFCKEINSVEICDNISTKKSIFFSREIDLQKQDNQVQIIQIAKKIVDSANNILDSKLIEIATCTNLTEHIDLAIEVQKTENSHKIIQIDNNFPVLFCTFPLIGSEKWRFPVVLNCTKFYPKTERDGILLLTGKDNGNQIRIENTANSHKTLLDFAITHKWENLYWLAKTDYDTCPTEWTSEVWYKSIFKNLRQHLITQKIVLNPNNKYLTLSETLFPTYHGKEKLELFWDICYDFIPSHIPQKSDIAIWNKIINADYSTWQTNFKYDLERLLKEIQDENNLLQLAENKFYGNLENTIFWLNKVIDFIFEQAEKPELLQKYSILPNKNNIFKKIGDKNNLLHSDIDAQIPNEIVNIYRGISSKDWADYLLHTKIKITDIPEIPKYGITHISQDIDKIISDRNTNQGLLRKAIYQIISYFLPSLSDDKTYTWRKGLWKFAKELDNSVPNFEELGGLTANFWNVADNWLLSTLIYDVQNTQDTENLKIKLNQETTENAINWLSDFIAFYVQNKKETFYSEKCIFPNQKGIFKKKQDVFFDNEIPEQLKNILDRFSHSKDNPLYWSFTNILLDKNIKDFEKHQSKSTKDISDKINELIKAIIKSDLTNPEKDTKGTYKGVFFDLVSFSSDNLFSKREQLFNFAHSIFNEIVSDKIEILSNLDEFDFTLANDWILTALAEKIQELESVEKLQDLNETFKIKNENQVIEWLDDFISFVASFEEKYANLLNKFAVIPNQNNNFRVIRYLKKDENIPNDLKKIAIAKHIRQDWNDWLLHKGLVNVNQNQNLFDETTTNNLKSIADEIDSHVRDYKGDKQDANFSELVFLLNQSETVKKDREKKYFPFFLNNKDMLIVGTLGEGQDLENVATILQDRKKLNVLAKIAKSSFTTEQLINFNQAVENMGSEGISIITEIAQSGISLAQLQQAIKIVGAEKISNLVKEAKEEQEQINFQTELGNLAEQIFKFELEKQGFVVERTGFGSDFRIKKYTFNCLVEIKSFVEGFESSVKMTSYQAQTAISSENYLLCVFPKTSSIPTEKDFREKAKFVTNIAENLNEIVNNLQILTSSNNAVGLFLEKGEYKFKISQLIWANGESLTDIIAYLGYQ